MMFSWAIIFGLLSKNGVSKQSVCLNLFLHNISDHTQCIRGLTVTQSALHDNSIEEDENPQASTDPFKLHGEV